ncbi:LacI family DNA-binding transcriptional regulator [Candidatus Darwinibacter acetoxidans]
MAGNRSRRARKRHVTIEDIARHLNISKATVSLALNNSSLVAEETRRRVIEAAEQFGYRPNYFGARLSRGKSDMIGLYILGGTEEQCNWMLPSSWMFYHPILKAVSEELSKHGYRFNLEVVSVEQVIKQGVISSVIQEGSLDGMLLVVQDDIDYSFLEIVEERQFPFVVLNAKVSETISSVKIDNALGASKAVGHLLERGHRTIAHLSGPEKDSNAVERLKGFRDAVLRAGLEWSPNLLYYGDWKRESGWRAAEAFLQLENRPTAIFCANDHMAIGAMQMLEQAGLKVPQDVSLIGFDDTELCQVVVPRLTTVRQPVGLMGELGAKAVLQQIDAESFQVTHTNLEPELIVRESTAYVSH